MSQLFSNVPQLPETSTQCWKIEHALKQMGKQKTLLFSSFCLVFLNFFFVISDAESKILGVLVINTSDTEELEELPACWRVELEE